MHKVALLKLLFVMANGVGSFAAIFMQRHFGLEEGELATTVALMIICYRAGNLVGGHLSGRLGSRALLLATSVIALASLSASLLPVWQLLSIGLILTFMFSAGLVTPLFSVMTARAAEPDDQVGAFAYLHLASNAGGVMLFVVGGLLLSWSSQYLVWFAVATSLVCLVTSALLPLPALETVPRLGSLGGRAGSGPIPCVVIVAGALFLGVSLLDGQREYQFPLWLGALDIGDSARLFAVAGIVNGLLVIVLTRPLIALTRRWSPMDNLALAALSYGIGFGAYAFVDGWLPILLFVGIWTLGEILGTTYMATLIAQRAPAARQGMLFSLIPVLQAGARVLCVGIAVPMLAGLGYNGAWAVFGIGGVLFGGICLLLHRYFSWRQSEQSR
ncbi:MFS transporter [Pseudomonas reidholzensis]|nr:MFS transporter [Pseudomonas reidholzensis]